MNINNTILSYRSSTKTIIVHTIKDKDCIIFGFGRSAKFTLAYHIKDLNLDDYYILKASASFKIVSIEEFLEFKHCKYMLLKKDKYPIENINLWLDWIHNNVFSHLPYVSKPFPPFNPNNKIIIKKR